jgi:hypothetical protein
MMKIVTPCPECATRIKAYSSDDLALEVSRLSTRLQALQNAVDRLVQHDEIPTPQNPQSMEKQEAKASIPRVKYIISTIDASGKRVEASGHSPSAAGIARTGSEFAFEVKNLFDDKGKSTYQITLISSSLREAIYRVLKGQFEHQKDTKWAEREPSLSVLKAPFTPLLMYWRELTKEAQLLAKNDDKTGTSEDFKILLQHIRDLQPQLVLRVESLQDATRISRDLIEVAFRPGTFVVAWPFPNQPQVFKVHSVLIEDDDSDSDNDNSNLNKDEGEHNVTIKCWAYDWEGAELVRVYYNFKVRNFSDEKEIKDFPCYPLQYYEDDDGASGLNSLRHKLISRGKHFRRVCTKTPGASSMCRYKGSALELRRNHMYLPQKLQWATRESLVSEPKDYWVLPKTNSAQTYEQIMVDFDSCQREFAVSLPINGTLVSWINANPCKCPLCLDIRDQSWITGFSETIIEAEDGAEYELDRNYILLPPRVLGFAFKSGNFAQFYVDAVDMTSDEDPEQEFERNLIFPACMEDNKADIKRLILGYKSDQEHQAVGDRRLISDAVEGKGKGLVILLHGMSKVPSRSKIQF